MYSGVDGGVAVAIFPILLSQVATRWEELKCLLKSPAGVGVDGAYQIFRTYTVERED